VHKAFKVKREMEKRKERGRESKKERDTFFGTTGTRMQCI